MSGVLSAGGLDWQFVIVTLAALWGGWILLRPLWASRKGGKPAGACGNCSSVACKTGAMPADSPASGLVAIGSGTPRKPRSSAGSSPGSGA